MSNLNLVQSGGLPGAFASMPFVGTAPIVESGSNANGHWIKYADGTMICRHQQSAGNVNLAAGAIFQTGSGTWTFPQAFNSNPVVSVSELWGVGDCWGGLGSAGTTFTTTTFRLFRASGIASTPIASLLAIGRWKA